MQFSLEVLEAFLFSPTINLAPARYEGEMNRQDEVKRMEADLKRLKETLEQRRKNRVNIIERRIQQLTGEAGAMEWE